MIWTPVDESLVGQVIDQKYRIDSQIGAGGMATVYRATRLLIGDSVAVKILHPEQLRDPTMSERFRREAQAAARLKHTNAVTIYDFGVSSEGTVYLVMELVEGQSLRSLIKQQGPMEPSAAAAILSQVCAALEEAHRQNIVHRDIKPDNIAVQQTEEGLRVKVLDFGIARIRNLATGNLTQTGSVLGTPHYMSPEQCMGEELDHRSDIYSMGIVLFEMLAGVVPFNSPTSTAVIIQHVNQAPPSLRTLNASIPAHVEAVVLHALAKRREERPQSAKALAEELHAAVFSGIAPPRASAAKPPTSAVETTAMPAMAGMAPTTHMKPQAGGAMSAPAPTRLAAPAPAVPKGKSRLVGMIAGALVLFVLGGTGMWVMLGNRSGKDEPKEVAENSPASTAGSPSPTPGANMPDTSQPAPSAKAADSGDVAPERATATEPAGSTGTPPLAASKTASSGLNSPAPASTNRALLTLRSNPSGVTVLVNGRPSGVTDESGFLNLKDLAPGAYVITLQREKHQPEERRVTLAAGHSQVLEVVLTPLRSYPEKFAFLIGEWESLIPANHFRMRVDWDSPNKQFRGYLTKQGQTSENVGFQLGELVWTAEPSDDHMFIERQKWRTGARGTPLDYEWRNRNFDVERSSPDHLVGTAEYMRVRGEVRPGQRESVATTLAPAPVEDQIGGLEQAFQRRQYDAVIRGAGDMMATNPNHPRLNYLMGLSLMGKQNPESVNYLARAIQNGEPVRFPIKHHHRSGFNDDLCNGFVTFSRDSFAFQSSDRSGHDFTAPMGSITTTKWEPQKEARINMEVVVGGERRTYNFHHTAATLVRVVPGNPNSLVVVQCRGCEPEMNVLYQLLLKMKQ